MGNLLVDISQDLSKFLNESQLIDLSFVSTSTFYISLNGIKYKKFIPFDNEVNNMNMNLYDLISFYKNNEYVKNDLSVESQILRVIKSSNIDDVNEEDSYGISVLHMTVCYIDNVKILNSLLEAGADVNCQDRYENYTPLHIAVDNDNIEMVNVLLNAGADINIKDGSGRKSLNFAIDNDNIEMVNVLLNAGADANIKD